MARISQPLWQRGPRRLPLMRWPMPSPRQSFWVSMGLGGATRWSRITAGLARWRRGARRHSGAPPSPTVEPAAPGARDLRASQALPAQALDLGGHPEGQPAVEGAGHRAAIVEGALAVRPPLASHWYVVRTETPAARVSFSTRQPWSRARATRRSRTGSVMGALL
jgi:hypothetical protein